jgi:hypothetical protein
MLYIYIYDYTIIIYGFAHIVTFTLLGFLSDCLSCISVHTNPRPHPLSSTMDIGFFPGGTTGGESVGI